MKTLDLVQGTPEWAAHRATHFNASDAPAMMGASAYTTRTQLLHQLHTGIAPEVDAATQRRFDDGHRFEALARPLAEKIIGEDLYPVVGVDGELSASFDGLTMAEDVAFEHKSLNDSLRNMMHADVKGHELGLQYRIQLEQQCMVSGCSRILFMASKWDGDNLVEERHCWYMPDMHLRSEINAGWTQFAKDLAAYVPQEVIIPSVATPQIGLPAVSITVNGSIALVDNLDKFGAALNSYIEKLNRKPETDTDFANLEDAVKRLKAAEDQLDAAESNALAQTDSIDAMRRTVALHRDTARTTRLLIDKLVKAEKENRRTKIIGDAVAELHIHIKALNERTRNFMPVIQSQFQEVVKGLKSLDSMKDKVSTELARCKIEANSIADRIQANLETKGLHGYAFLFSDIATLCLKPADDFQNTVTARITHHEAAEAEKEAQTRARIQAEEQAKAERAAREKLAAEQAAADKLAREHEQLERDEIARLAKLNTTMIVDVTPVREVVLTRASDIDLSTINPRATRAPTMSLGEISTRLGFNVTSVFLASLGFEATTVKAAKLFHAEDFTDIGKAIIEHIESVCELQAA